MAYLYLLGLPEEADVEGNYGFKDILVIANSELQAKRTLVLAMMEYEDAEYADDEDFLEDVLGKDNVPAYTSTLSAIRVSQSLTTGVQRRITEMDNGTLPYNSAANGNLPTKPAEAVQMVDLTLYPYNSPAAAEVLQLLNQNSAQLSNCYNDNARAVTMAKILGYNHAQRNKTAPQCALGWTRMVEAVSVKLTEMNWPCKAKETVLADLRRLPYGKSAHRWELNFTGTQYTIKMVRNG